MSAENVDWPWTIAEIFRRDDGVVEFLLRWRVLPGNLVRSRWPTALTITWENRFSTPEGFPVDSELEAMGQFEVRLGEAVEHDALAVMSLSITGQKERVLVFHTKDVTEFSRRLHAMPQEKERYPIRIEASEDPGWACFDETFQRFGLEPDARPSLLQRLKNLLGW